MRLFAEGGMMAANIQGKVVVITGASSGVGESTARLLAGNGAKVVLGARRKDRIDAVVKDITAKGGSALGFKTDVTKRGDVEALDTGSVDKYGRIDAIVNNSGIMPIAPMATLKVEEWDRMIDVNIKGVLYGGCRRPTANAEAEERSYHQHRLRYRDQSVRTGWGGLRRHKIRCAHVD
jgi:NADP-dependent 3-hydroxy acid dehydrogenase YdfG